jgi:hypothetical protein
MVPSESVLPVPLSVTMNPELTVWAVPALATGAALAPPVGLTVTLTVAGALMPPRLSVTRNENVSVVVAAGEGAVKVGCAAVVLDRVTVVPAVCDQV